jgi:hypothetical protein
MGSYRARSGENETYTLASGAVGNANDMIAINSSGLAASATKATGLVVVGLAEHSFNTANGDTTVTVRQSGGALDFSLVNDTVNPVVQATVEETCYIFNATSVTALSTGSSPAGTVKCLDTGPGFTGNVWVRLTR